MLVSMIRLAVALVLCLALGACGQSVPPKKSNAQERRDADALLLKDVVLAGPELEQRLTASIQVQDGLIIVHDPVIGQIESYVLPASSSWTISCGFAGLSVALGNSVSGGSISGEATSLGNDIELRLAEARIDQKDCAVLGPRLGKRLKAILQGDQSAPP
jgi:hypothetical protein